MVRTSRGPWMHNISINVMHFQYNFISNLHSRDEKRVEYFTHFSIITRLTLDGMTQKAQSLEDILHQLGPITDVSFEPFQTEPKQTAKALLPPSFPSKPHPFDYFSLFFTHDLLQTITTNTNQYANI